MVFTLGHTAAYADELRASVAAGSLWIVDPAAGEKILSEACAAGP